ncbi:hypothetical protein Tco_0202335, partial [Tanacetum coccineum]
MMTARKRVGPLPTHRLAVRHFAYHSSLDSSSEASSDFHSDASFDPSSRHSLSDHSSPDLPTLSPVHADLKPSSNRIRDSDYLADVEVDSKESYKPSRSRGTDVGVDDDIKRVDKSHSEPEIIPMQATIEACFDFADIIRSRGID